MSRAEPHEESIALLDDLKHGDSDDQLHGAL